MHGKETALDRAYALPVNLAEKHPGTGCKNCPHALARLRWHHRWLPMERVLEVWIMQRILQM